MPQNHHRDNSFELQTDQVDREDCLGAIHMIGSLYSDQGKLDEAEKMYIRALKGYKDALGLELVKTYIPALNTLWGLGNLYAKTKLDEFRSVYVKALSGYTKVRVPSSDICTNLKQSLDAMDTTKPVEINLGSSARQVVSNDSGNHKPEE